MAGINVWGGLQIVRNRRGRNAKVAVEFRAPELVFSPDERAIARQLATTLTTVFREYMLDGRWLDGRPLPQVDGETVARRRYRVLQVQNGTAGKERRRLDRRFATKKLGTTYPDAATSGRGLVGLESGTMAKSLAVAPSGKGMRIFVADVRGKLDRSGSSAWLRVLRKMQGIGGLSGVFADQRVESACKEAWRASWVMNGRRLGSELARTVELLKAIEQEAQDLAESDVQE